MQYGLNFSTRAQRVKSNAKKYLLGATTAIVMAGGVSLPAFAAGGPTTGPVPGPGCFGNWRAGSVQAIKASGGNAGTQYFSQRAGDNSTINAENRAECAL
jgi:hypothetical protein